MTELSEQSAATPKDVFLWLGILISLYWSVIALGQLLFLYITYSTPQPFTVTDPYHSNLSYDMAALVILFPLLLVLLGIVYREQIRTPVKKSLWVRRWTIGATLFLSTIAIVIDLISLLNTFFSGAELPLSFILKSMVVFVLAISIFLYFIADLRNFWNSRPKLFRGVGILSLLVVYSLIGIGFNLVGTPQHARLIRLDLQRVSDLMQLQSEITSYYSQTHALPSTLATLTQSGLSVPQDPQTGMMYGYVPSTNSFSICATFAASSTNAVVEGIPQGSLTSWNHGAGYTCFTRTVRTY